MGRSYFERFIQGVAGSIPGGGIYAYFEFFRFLPVAHSSAKPIQIKSSMNFIQGNGCKERDLIFFRNDGSIYDDMSAFKFHLYPSRIHACS